MSDKNERTADNLRDQIYSALSALDRIDDGQAGSAEEAAAEAIAVYLAAGGIKSQIDELLWKRAKDIIQEIMVETGQLKFETEYGRAYVPRSGVSVSYDWKGLDALCQKYPEVAELIRPYRIERERPGSLTIR